MAARRLLKMGEARLLDKATSVESFGIKELRMLIADMRDTMAAATGAGLAAPQIGIARRVVIFGVHNNPRYPEAENVPDTVLINPTLEVLDGTVEYEWEGCLSLPGLRGYVPRHRRIRYAGFNENGEYFEREATGFHARVVQHECDHLDGILFPMRMDDMSKLGFEDVLNF